MKSVNDIPLPSEAFLENRQWILSHIGELMERHSDQWVAVDGGRVLAAGADLGEVAEATEKLTTSSDVVYEFLASGTMIF